MRFSSSSFALSGLLLLAATAAKADTFNFAALGSGGGFSGSGSLTTGAQNADGSYTITGITGTGVTGLLAPNSFFANDNLLFPTATRRLDVSGFAFTESLGGDTYFVNIFSTVAGYEAVTLDTDGDYTDVPVTFTLTGAAAVTPEPSSLILLGSGFLSLAATRLRRRNS